MSVNGHDAPRDWESAAVFFTQAREAEEAGDERTLNASLYLLKVALGFANGPKVNTSHLK